MCQLLITLLVYIKHNTSPLIINRGVFVIPLPTITPHTPSPEMGGRIPPPSPPPFICHIGGIIPSVMYSQKNSGKNFWEKIPQLRGVYIYI